MNMREPDGEGPKPGRAKWGHGRVVFFALRAEIAAELDRKVPMSRIYAKHKARLAISYRQFTRLVRELREEMGPRQGALFDFRAQDGEEAAAQAIGGQVGGLEPRKPAYAGAPENKKYRDFHYDPMDAYRIKFD